MTTPQLPGSAGRGRTYAFMAGVVATSLTLAVGLPLVLADRPQEQLASAPVGDDAFAVPSGAPGLPAVAGAPAPTDLPAALPEALPAAEAPAADAGPLPAAPLPGTPQDPAPGTAGPAAAPAPGGSRPAPAEPRRASDQGVTATTITLGVFIVDLRAASAIGADVAGQDADGQRRLANAYAEEVNSRGGVGGRRLKLAFRTVDILDQQSMRDACTDFAETDRVFAVFQVLGVYGDPILKCTRDLRLPMLQNDSAVSAYYTQARGYLFTTQPSTLRTQVDMVRQLQRLGEFRGKTVGFLYEDGYLLPDNEATIRELGRFGVRPVRGVVSSSDAGLALRQIPAVAQDMCLKGVDHVVLAINSLYGSQFVENMTRFGCRPAYSVSDFDFTMNGDGFPQAMPDAYFDRALSITASRTGEGRVGRPEPGHDAACRAVAERRLGTRLDRNDPEGSYVNTVIACTLVELFKAGAEAAGPNPTRATFVQALARTGSFQNGNYGASSFAPGRLDAPRVVRVTRAFLDCKCWKPQTDFFTP